MLLSVECTSKKKNTLKCLEECLVQGNQMMVLITVAIQTDFSNDTRAKRH